MDKPRYRFMVLVALAFLHYATAALLGSNLWADIAAPVFDLLAAGMVLHACLTSKNKMFKANFLLAGAAVLSWAIGDTLWLVYEYLFHIDPDTSNLVAVFYFATNILLIATTVYYAYYRLRKWDSVQLLIDSVVFALAILWFLWVVLYDKSLSAIAQMQNNGIVNAITIGLDVFMIVIIGIWYLSIRKGTIPVFLRILVSAVFIYSTLDLIYFHQYFRGLYVPDALLDVGYLASLLGIAASIKLYYIQYPTKYDDQNPNTNVGRRHKGLFLLFCPVLIALVADLDVYDIVFYLLIILIHESGSSYIQRSIDNKSLLQQEIEINKKLEALVSEKTQDLISANEALRNRNLELNFINLHDSLTGLHNRVYFMQKLEEDMQAVDLDADEKVVMIVWNIDNLKGINDTYGHNTGDQILIQHAHRVRNLFQKEGVLARLGGDEFVYLLRAMYHKPAFQNMAEKIVRTCKQPFTINGYKFNITVAVGIASYPYSASDITSLLKHADIAMHYVKDARVKNHIAWYLDITEAMQRKRMIADYLKTADYNQDLTLFYQPIFRVSDGKMVGMEALLRWNCPELGPVSPAEFVPIAEDENLIIPIGNWVIENAVKQVATWNHSYQTRLRVGINFSPKQFDQDSSFTVLDASIKRHHAEFDWIDIEITEGVAMDNENSAEKIKNNFKKKGISISIDDFGTGYSSLGYLNILSFDRIKIAKPLTDKITYDDSARKIVTSIILLAKSLGLKTLSEGVENKEQFALLDELGIDQIQGYYLSKPLSAKEFETIYLKPKT